MIIDTFTRDELITTLNEAFEILIARAYSYAEKNIDFVSRNAKGEGYARTFSGIIKKQRYYLDINYLKQGEYIKVGARGLITFIGNESRTLIIIFDPFGDPNDTHGTYVKLTTEHFINRYCERSGIKTDGKTLHEKVQYFTHGTSGGFTGIPTGDFIRRNGKPALKIGFLDSSNAQTWLSCNSKGDVAIIEMYGNIPVWRTYITHEMLYERQKEDPYYQALMNLIERNNAEEAL